MCHCMIESVKTSIKNLYRDGKLTVEKIKGMTSLTDEEKEEILAVKAE